MLIRYDTMRIDKLLIKHYQQGIADVLGRIEGLNDIARLLEEWEEEFSQYIGTRHALALNSGTDALQIALLALKLKKGDEVIVPNITYPAVPLAVLYAGGIPVPVDCRPQDYQMDPDSAEKLISKQTKGIIAVHMFGRPAPLDILLKLAKDKKLFLIEDVCQAESSEYKKHKCGSFGDLSCFSFSYYKPLSSCGGGGGMLCFNNPAYKKIAECTNIWKDEAVLLDAGQRFARMYLWDLIAVTTKFKFLKDIIKSRLKIKAFLENELAGISDIRFPRDGKDTLTVPQVFVISSRERDPLGRHLNDKGIQWQRPYTPLHKMKIFQSFIRQDMPNSDTYERHALHLPLFSFMKESEALFIADVIKKFFVRAGKTRP
jgi:dTDP-4-amino-4,6-dideoxygalactose transaminase